MKEKSGNVIAYPNLHGLTENVHIKEEEKSPDPIFDVDSTTDCKIKIEKIDYDASVKCKPCYVDLHKGTDLLQVLNCKKCRKKLSSGNAKRYKKSTLPSRENLLLAEPKPCYVNVHKWKNLNELLSCKHCPRLQISESDNIFATNKCSDNTSTVVSADSNTLNCKPCFVVLHRLRDRKRGKTPSVGNKFNKKSKDRDDEEKVERIVSNLRRRKNQKGVRSECIMCPCNEVNKNSIKSCSSCKCQQPNKSDTEKIPMKDLRGRRVYKKPREVDHIKKFVEHLSTLKSYFHPKISVRKPFTSSKCRKNFASYEGLKYHLQSQHGGGKSSQCENQKNTIVYIIEV